MEEESRVHYGLRPKLNEHTFYIETVICKCIYRVAATILMTFASWETWSELRYQTSDYPSDQCRCRNRRRQREVH